MATQERINIDWITNVKAISIILVYLSHMPSFFGGSLGLFNSLIEPFYVNAFFFVSGYLLFWKHLSSPSINETTKSFITNGRGRRTLDGLLFKIAIPSIFFAAVMYVPKKIIKGGGIELLSFVNETIGGCAYWFTGALIVAQLLLIIALCTRIKNIWFYFIVGAIFSYLGWYLNQSNFDLFPYMYDSFPWMYKTGMKSTIYLVLGGLYWKYESAISSITNKSWLIILVLIAYIVVCITKPIDFKYSFSTINIAGVVMAGVGSILLITMCKKMPHMKAVSFIGNNSLAFYFLCGGVPIVICNIAKIIIPINTINMLLLCALCIASVYAIVYVLNRWFPWLFDLRILVSNKIK